MAKLVKKHPLAIRWFHWLNFPMLAVMIWSGLLIYWANDIYGVRFGETEIVKLFPARIFGQEAPITKVVNGKAVDNVLPGENGDSTPISDTTKVVHGIDLYAPKAPGWWPGQWAESSDPDNPAAPKLLYKINNRLAEGMGWHFLFMWLFTINGVLYVLFTAVSGQWRYLVPRRGTLKHALQTVLHDLHLRREPPPAQKFNGAQQIAYTSIILMGIGSVLTGIAIYKPTQASWLTAMFGGYMAAKFIHFWLMMGYVGFFLVHIVQVIRAGWNNFRAMLTGYELGPAELAESAATISAGTGLT